MRMVALLIIDTEAIRNSKTFLGIKKKYIVNIGFVIWILNILWMWILLFTKSAPEYDSSLQLIQIILYLLFLLTGLLPFGWIGIILIQIGKSKKKQKSKK